MLKLILFVLSTAGFSYQITSAKIFAPLRDYLTKKSAFLGKLFKCALCLATWIAIPMYYIIYLAANPYLMIVPYMGIGSITSFLLYLILHNKTLRNVITETK